MTLNRPTPPADGAEETADFAKAFQELAKGERTATALEQQLSAMEAKIEALLAQAEKDQHEVAKAKAQSLSRNGSAGISNENKEE